MSIMWSLMKISRGQQFSLVLCVLCLIVQWSCHCSAEDQAHGPSITATNTNRAHPDVPSTIKSSLDKSNVTATPEVSNTSAPNSSAQSSSNQLTTESDINETGVIFQGNQSIPSVFNSTESISTNLSSTTHSDSFNGRNGAKSEMQDKIKHSKTNQPVVLISLLTCGLILAAIILAAYYRVNKRSWSPQSKRLEEEPDAQDHDSTMFSVASEDQSDAHEKPRLNGEAQESGENQRSAAGTATGNGHQRKTIEEADTEL